MEDFFGAVRERLDPVPHMVYADAKRLRRCSSIPVEPVSKVFDGDNLLIEIIVRLGFPTTLICTSLVCKRWLWHASDPAILCRFRKLHPPRLLGFYVKNMFSNNPPNFVPMLPQPLELDAVIRRANFSLDTYKGIRIRIVDCRNNNIFIRSGTSSCVEVVERPLCPVRGIYSFPQLPPRQLQHGGFYTLCQLVFKEEGDRLSYFYVCIESIGMLTKSTVHVYKFQDGSWCIPTSFTSTHLHYNPWILRHQIDNKIYIASLSNILVFDLSTSEFSIIQLPQGVGYRCVGETVLSPSDDDSGVYLICANDLQLDIWLHKREKWSLVDTICLREMLANLKMSDHTFEDGHTDVVLINQVGNNVGFVFLQIGRSILYLDTKCRTLHKVYGIEREGILHRIHPFFMIWPPTFPTRKENPASEITSR